MTFSFLKKFQKASFYNHLILNHSYFYKKIPEDGYFMKKRGFILTS